MIEPFDLRMANAHALRRRTAVEQMRSRAHKRRTVPWWKRWLPRVDWDGLLP